MLLFQTFKNWATQSVLTTATVCWALSDEKLYPAMV